MTLGKSDSGKKWEVSSVCSCRAAVDCTQDTFRYVLSCSFIEHVSPARVYIWYKHSWTWIKTVENSGSGDCPHLLNCVWRVFDQTQIHFSFCGQEALSVFPCSRFIREVPVSLLDSDQVSSARGLSLFTLCVIFLSRKRCCSATWGSDRSSTEKWSLCFSIVNQSFSTLFICPTVLLSLTGHSLSVLLLSSL